MSFSQHLSSYGPGLALTRLASLPGLFADLLLRRGLTAARVVQTRWPWVGTQLRRLVLLLWWTCTLQLGTHARYWLLARQRRRTTPPAVRLPLIQAVRAEDLVVPGSDRPAVSVIVPTYGKLDYTLRCLASIAAHPPAATIEVIVVDDAFPGTETACLSQVRGIRLLRNEENLGFLRSCNAAAQHATGAHLLFLNNDTQVLPGWLDSMLELFETRSDVGAVGSKLLYADGRLQEAGGIIWSDASGWNYGRYEDPTRPEYNYVREVDYCSGASLMVPLALFLDLGGFDVRSAPAYFEDTDLCFRLRTHGLKTLYQPRSEVVHFEGVSHGRDVALGIKSFQAVNRRSFLHRWGPTLAREHYPNAEHVLRARERGRGRGVALVVDHKLPEPDRDAGSRAMLCVLRALLADGMIVKFWPHNLAYAAGYAEALQAMGVEVFHGPHQVALPTWLREHGQELDLVLLSRPEVAEAWLDAVRSHSSARIADYGHDLPMVTTCISAACACRARWSAMRVCWPRRTGWRSASGRYGGARMSRFTSRPRRPPRCARWSRKWMPAPWFRTASRSSPRRASRRRSGRSCSSLASAIRPIRMPRAGSSPRCCRWCAGKCRTRRCRSSARIPGRRCWSWPGLGYG